MAALVLHGRVGLWSASASDLVTEGKIAALRAVLGRHEYRTLGKAARAARVEAFDLRAARAAYLRFAHASIWRHVVAANRASGLEFPIFLHSWHPELGGLLDELYRPIASAHDEFNASIDKVQSQHRSMARGLAMATQHGDAKIKHVMVARYDLFFYTDLVVAPLVSSTQNVPLWLPHWCHRVTGVEYAPSMAETAAARAACGFSSSWHGDGSLATRPSCKGWVCTRFQHTAADRNLVLDWWFVARVSVARAFAEIDAKFAEYSEKVALLLDNDTAVRKKGYMRWSHFYWGYIIDHVLKLRQNIRYVMYEGVDFTLARFWHNGAHCQPSAPRLPTSEILAGMARRLARPSEQCPADSRNAGGARLFCPWYAPSCGGESAKRMLELEAMAKAVANVSAFAGQQRLSMKLVGKARYLARLKRERVLASGRERVTLQDSQTVLQRLVDKRNAALAAHSRAPSSSTAERLQHARAELQRGRTQYAHAVRSLTRRIGAWMKRET